jgi:hypothetical protein
MMDFDCTESVTELQRKELRRYDIDIIMVDFYKGNQKPRSQIASNTHEPEPKRDRNALARDRVQCPQRH